MSIAPVLLLGAGRMGGALIEGWRRTGAFAPSDLILIDPYAGAEARAAAEAGARLNPGPEVVAEALTVLLGVKPQVWRDAAAPVVPQLSSEAVVVSILAGVRLTDVEAGFGGRRVARVMPTTAVAVGKGAASVYAPDEEARARAHALFAPVAAVADLDDEDLMDAATAVSGSAPAYVYALVEALEAAGVAQGLPPETARALVRATLQGAAALMAHTGEEPAELRRQVTSPGGTTAAALEVLMGERGFGPLLQEAVAAAVARARALAG